MRAIKLTEGRIERWRVETDDGDPYLYADVAHRNGEVLVIDIYGGGLRCRLTMFEVRALMKVLGNYKI